MSSSPDLAAWLQLAGSFLQQKYDHFEIFTYSYVQLMEWKSTV